MAKKKRTSRIKRTARLARGKEYQVFVSHATADKGLATVLCEKIESTGATTFRDDRDINGGDDIPQEIRSQIHQSQELVVLLTPESADRPWVLIEVAAAWSRRRDYRIVAVLCHSTVDRIPDIIKGKRAFTMNEFDQYLSELRKRVQK